MSQSDLEALLSALRTYGVTKYETPEICVELGPASWAAGGTATTQGPEEPDFDPGEAYKEAIQKAADAIVEANGKRS